MNKVEKFVDELIEVCEANGYYMTSSIDADGGEIWLTKEPMDDDYELTDEQLDSMLSVLQEIEDERELGFKKVRANAVTPFYATSGSAGMDLSAAIDVPMFFKPLERRLVPTGLMLEIPKGYEVQIRPRSGLSIKSGMTLINCIGTIDEDYKGEIMIPMVNLSDKEYAIQPLDRIAQMVVSPVQQVKAVEIDKLSESERGAGGFGSTGV